MTPKVNAAVLRRLAGVPIVADADEAGWETRKTGSAALECALVAAGLLEVARFAAPNIWDIARGIALVEAGVVLFACRMVATGWRWTRLSETIGI